MTSSLGRGRLLLLAVLALVLLSGSFAAGRLTSTAASGSARPALLAPAGHPVDRTSFVCHPGGPC